MYAAVSLPRGESMEMIEPETRTDFKQQKLKAIRKCLGIMNEFKKLDPEMPLQQMITFIEVALASDKGIGVSDLAQRVGNSQSSASRHVAILGEHGRNGTPALRVVQATTNLMDRRSQVVRLSPKGQRVIDNVVEILTRED